MVSITRLDSGTVTSVGDEYGLRVSASQQIVGGLENTSYLLQAQGMYVMTVLEKKTLSEAAAYAQYLCALADRRLPVMGLVRRVAGGYVAHRHDKPIIVSEYVDGRSYDPFPAARVADVGAALAAVHNASGIECSLRPHIRLSLEQLDRAERFTDAAFSRWLLGEHERVRYVVGRGGVMVPTHCDLFPDNIIIGSAGMTFIDWEDGGLDYPWIDVGMAVLGLCCSDRFIPDRARALLAGYRAVAGAAVADELIMDSVVYGAVVTGYHRHERREVGAGDQRRSYGVVRQIVESLQRWWGEATR